MHQVSHLPWAAVADFVPPMISIHRQLLLAIPRDRHEHLILSTEHWHHPRPECFWQRWKAPVRPCFFFSGHWNTGALLHAWPATHRLCTHPCRKQSGQGHRPLAHAACASQQSARIAAPRCSPPVCSTCNSMASTSHHGF